ncbi:hypothetical protein JG688_00003027 [Phytophthora aleatoria]|uniref:Uncharacterized protein n=1 Tax=Phytophthora aleatoria TaxID=2496075 RepID=A0A8J5J298_9STRA|nr:hypothetical protein JG688_00003027 [Phytophthora aleatoria]
MLEPPSVYRLYRHFLPTPTSRHLPSTTRLEVHTRGVNETWPEEKSEFHHVESQNQSRRHEEGLERERRNKPIKSNVRLLQPACVSSSAVRSEPQKKRSAQSTRVVNVEKPKATKCPNRKSGNVESGMEPGDYIVGNCPLELLERRISYVAPGTAPMRKKSSSAMFVQHCQAYNSHHRSPSSRLVQQTH